MRCHVFCFLMRLTILSGFATTPLVAGAAEVSEPQRLLLWPDGAPLATGSDEADQPSLTIYSAPDELADGSAVVVCPGGGYGHLAVDHEGRQIAEWLNSLGTTALVLRYRIAPKYRHPCPLLDVQRAVRLARASAEQWKIDPAWIGVIGFSAGGHLASTIATHFDAGDPSASDPVDRASCRPDFVILLYPVISLIEGCAHAGSRRNLLGESPPAELVEQLSNERQVTAATPPTLLVHTSDDQVVPPENSVLFYLALREAGVPAELHIYEHGPHGFGLGGDDPVLSTWPNHCAAWLKHHRSAQSPQDDTP